MAQSTVEQIKAKLDVVAVLSQYIQLTKAGSTYKARCPFHSEKTPSFTVSPVRDSYHCFGCGEHGDMFTFVEKVEGVDFKGALKILAEKAGVEIIYEHTSGPSKDERERLFAVLEDATKIFIRERHGHAEITEYLRSRGLSDSTIDSFRIGFIPEGWHHLYDGLIAKNHSDADIEAAGLILKGEKGSYYDRFRSRIMFPLMDPAGRVIGFTGRVWKGDETSAKYVNSPETLLFHKSHFLYGFDRAKMSIRKLNCTLLVEGQMDLIACHQSGYTNAVAISGTALTEEQLLLLSRLSKNLICALDADKAGVSATIKSASRALMLGYDVKVASFAGGKDASDIVQSTGADGLKQVIKNAEPVVPFITNVLYERAKQDDRVFVRLVEEELLPVIASMRSKLEQSHAIQWLSRRMNIDATTLFDALRQKIVPGMTEQKQPVQKSSHIDAPRMLSGVLVLAKEKNMDTDTIQKELSSAGVVLPAIEQSELPNIEHQIESTYGSLNAEVIHRLFTIVLLDSLRGTVATITQELRAAEREGNTEKTAQLLEISQNLHKKIASLHV